MPCAPPGLMFPSAKTAASKSYKLVCARLVRAPSSDVSEIMGQLSDMVQEGVKPCLAQRSPLKGGGHGLPSLRDGNEVAGTCGRGSCG